MLQVETHITPTHLKQLPIKVDLATEEARLIRKIIALSDHLGQIQNFREQTNVINYIRLEIADLESQLVDVRDKASL